MTFAAPTFSHLRRLTDAGGVYEHAMGSSPRPEHGYCLDDVARALVVSCRSTGQGGAQPDLIAHYLAFVLEAQQPDGSFVNRRGADLVWTGEPTLEDCWGRGLWGLGAVVASSAPAELRSQALEAFERGATCRSSWPRAMAFAGLGAALVLDAHPDHRVAGQLLRHAAAQIAVGGGDADWPWPEPRLTYANAVLPQVLITAGARLGLPSVLDRGLELLAWLLTLETTDGHLSVTPVGGRGPEDLPRRFDQQPIEAASLAEACATAYAVTSDPRWAEGIELAASWFFGANDAGVSLYDPVTGGGCDGLQAGGRNVNQGAESTLALMSTLQQARWLAQTRV